MSRGRIKCHFCEWSRPVFWTTRGKRYSGFEALRNHMLDEHTKQWDELQARLAADGFEKERDR